jgi:hypothetical protein
VEVDGEFSLQPSFRLRGREATLRLYQAARNAFCAGEDLKAMQQCERALTMADRLHPRPREMGDALNLLGALHLKRNAPSLAVKCLERALTLRDAHTEGPAESYMAATMRTLGTAQQALGNHAEA